jgi:hypothetical protein
VTRVRRYDRQHRNNVMTVTRNIVRIAIVLVCLILLSVPLTSSLSYEDVRGVPYVVDYDQRAFRVNGQRVLLIAGEIHYPRSSPSMWKQIMSDAKAAGINVVQTYLFWNYHEFERGQWDWISESRHLALFLQSAADAGLFVLVRMGAYICGEWMVWTVTPNMTVSITYLIADHGGNICLV